MESRSKFVTLGVAAVASALASIAWASVSPDLPAIQHAGSVTYLSGGGTPAQEQAMQNNAKQYPLELQFLWGRGAKETLVTASNWSLRDGAGHVVAAGHSGGPIILASLPSGHYSVRATCDGNTITRSVNVLKDTQNDVLLEWPQ